MSPLFVVCQWPCVNNVHSAVIIQNINNLDEPPAGRRADNPQFLVSPRASGYGGCAFSTTACASLAGTPCLVACSAFQSFQRKAATSSHYTLNRDKKLSARLKGKLLPD
jgi:hypothetical protein